MNKRSRLRFVCALLCCLFLCGCWDYRGLDELSIVAGIAIDPDPDDPDGFLVAFEIVDMSKSGALGEMKATLVETKGRTLTEAVYNANRQLHSNMYFGNAEILILNQEIAAARGFDCFLDPLLRDKEIRDNQFILISGEDTAKMILEDQDHVQSFYLKMNLDNKEKSANAVKPVQISDAYNKLTTDTRDLCLPVIRFLDEDHTLVILDQLALISDDRMVGTLDEHEIPYYLIATSKLNTGSINLIYDEEGDEEEDKYSSLSIYSSRPKHKVSFDGERFTLRVDVDMVVGVSEFSHDGWDEIDATVIYEMERQAARAIEREIKRVIQRARDDYGMDMIDFSNSLHDNDPKIWKQVEDDWDAWFRDAEVEINCKLTINDTGMILNY